MFRQPMAAAMAAMVFAILSAQQVAADLSPLTSADNILPFNITILPSWGMNSWTPMGEMFGPAEGDKTPWRSMYDGQFAPDNTTIVYGRGVGKFILDSPTYDRGSTPTAYFKLPAEGVWWKGSFKSNTGDDSALRIWAEDLLNNNSLTRQSSPDFIRYYNGQTQSGMPKFAYQRMQFGIVSGYQGGGRIEYESAVVQMSMVTKAPDWPSAINNADKRYFLTAETNLDDSSFDGGLQCTPGARASKGEDANGREHLYVTWRARLDEHCTLDIPKNTSMVYVNGTTGPMTDGFEYEWTPELPGDMANATTGTATTKTRFLRTNEPLLIQTLDPRIKYSLRIASDQSKGDFNVSLYSATFFQAAWDNQLPTFNHGQEGGNANVVSSKSNDSNKGAVIGGAVGGVLGALVIAGLAIYLCCAHRRKRAKESTNLHGKHMEADDTNITPFIPLDRSRPPHDDTPLSEAPSSTMASRPLHVRAGTMDSDSQFWSDDGRSSPTGFASLSSIPSTTKSPPPSTISRPPMARREVISEMDAGTLEPISDTVEYEYVPPQYNPDWARSNESTVSSRAAQRAHRHRSAMGASTLGADSNAGDYETAASVEETLGPMSPTSTVSGVGSTGVSTNYSSARSHHNYSHNY